MDLYQLHLTRKHYTVSNTEISYIKELHIIKKKRRFMNKLHVRSSNVQLQFLNSVSITKSDKTGTFQIMVHQGESESGVKSLVIFL